MLRDTNNKKKHFIVVGKGGGGGIEQVQSDWAQTDNTQVDYIKNKPTVYNEWFGTQAEFDLIDPKDPDTIYYIEDANGSVVHNNKTYGIKVKIEQPELTDVQITSNGTYQHTGYYGYDEVEVNVQPNLTTLNATTNDTYTPTSPVQGYSSVTVNVQPNLTTLNATTNDTYTPTSPVQGYSEVTVNVQPNLTTLNATANGTYTPTSPVQGYSSVTVNIATPQYFYIEDISGLDNVLSITKANANAPTIEVFKSTDGTNWTSMGNTSTTAITAAIPADGKLYLKATTNEWAYDYSRCNKITASRNHRIGGNIMSLLYGDNYANQTTFASTNTFFNLFDSNNKLISASNLNLAATTLTHRCYEGMFMNCTSLVKAPVLPATTLDSRCYTSMFSGCTSLTKAPVLPATRLTSDCYNNMFSGCTALTTAPVLPATTLANYCYAVMFKNCSSLNTVTTYAENISAGSCLLNWLQNVAATGDFYNLGTATYATDSPSGIPTGWTEHNSL